MPYTKQGIYYEVQGSGPALVFSHGLLMNRTMFDQQVAHFKSSYTCIAWDERCHGKTAQDNFEPFSYYDSAADLMSILDELNIEDAVLIGMSQGGFLSLRAALKYPARVKALVLIDSQAGLEDPTKAAGYKKVIDDCEPLGHLPSEVCEGFADIIMHPSWSGTGEWVELWTRYNLKHVQNALHTLMTRDDISQEIRAIKVPALVIHGSEDRAIPLERAEEMAKALASSQMFVIEGERHAPNMSSPGEVNARMDEFLARVK